MSNGHEAPLYPMIDMASLDLSPAVWANHIKKVMLNHFLQSHDKIVKENKDLQISFITSEFINRHRSRLYVFTSAVLPISTVHVICNENKV